MRVTDTSRSAGHGKSMEEKVTADPITDYSRGEAADLVKSARPGSMLLLQLNSTRTSGNKNSG